MSHLDLNERVAIVTGGARGIGYAIAERVLHTGGRVSLWDMDGDTLDAGPHRCSITRRF